jgi:hypothetical protein
MLAAFKDDSFNSSRWRNRKIKDNRRLFDLRGLRDLLGLRGTSYPNTLEGIVYFTVVGLKVGVINGNAVSNLFYRHCGGGGVKGFNDFGQCGVHHVLNSREFVEKGPALF